MFIKLKQSNSRGFTIVETLIVLGVTGMMFLSTSLLVQGQIERSRYQDSMRQLQQLVQNTINDTGNGYFPGANGSDPNAVYAGKRIYFCTNGSMTPADSNSRQPCETSKSQIRVENIYWNPATATNPTPDTDGVSTPTFDTDIELNTGKVQYIQYPASVEYKKFHKSDDIWYPSSAGFSVMFSNVDAVSGSAKSTIFQHAYIDNNNSASTEDAWNTGVLPYSVNGMKICFSGYKNGSLVIGRGNSLNVEMNLDDAECN